MPKSGVEDSLAKISLWQIKASASDSKDIEVDSFKSLSAWLRSASPNGSSWKTFLASSIVTKERISLLYSQRWTGSGILWLGEYLTLNTSEHLNDVEECSLLQVVKVTAPRESFLGADHLTKWLERAELRAPNLDPSLRRAFEEQLSSQSSTPPSVESHTGQGHKERDIEATDLPTRSTQGAAPTWSVRRMLASEYERLQGFPENWTLVD